MKTWKRFQAALWDGGSAGRLGLCVKLLGPPLRAIDGFFEKKMEIPGEDKGQPPPAMMILGASRSGSTLVYQVLTRAIPSVYITNLHALFPSIASGFLMDKEMFGSDLSGFNNFYGYSSRWNDVYEGNEMVSNLLRDINSKSKLRRGFIRFAHQMEADIDRPLIFKNIRAFDKVVALHRAVPEMHFLRIRRDPVDHAKSLVKAYNDLGYFNPIPDSLKNVRVTDPLEFAVRLICEIDKVFEKQKERVDPTKWLEYTYEDFCAYPGGVINECKDRLLGKIPVELRLGVLNETFEISKKHRIDRDDEKRILEYMEKYR